MFKKPKKVLYAFTTDERAFLEQAARQAALVQRGVQHFLNEVALRERIPPGSQFDANLLAFVPAPPAEKPGA